MGLSAVNKGNFCEKCADEIIMSADHIRISRHNVNNSGYKPIFYHTECFEELAGKENLEKIKPAEVFGTGMVESFLNDYNHYGNFRKQLFSLDGASGSMMYESSYDLSIPKSDNAADATSFTTYKKVFEKK